MYTQSLLEHADVAVMMDIKAPCDVYHRDVDVECPARQLEPLARADHPSLTSSLEFGLHVDANEFQTHLGPYLRSHFKLGPTRRSSQCRV